jgi:O-methyltransferase
MKRIVKGIFRAVGVDVRRALPPEPEPVDFDIPDADLYRPLFCPWEGESEFRCLYERARERSLVSPDRFYVLYTLIQQAMAVPGDVWECGVYKGGTASMFAELLARANTDKSLFLFDTFEGMPETDPDHDWHQEGDFSDTTLQAVRDFVGHGPLCNYRKGLIPDTFEGLDDQSIAFAHIDVDIYQSIKDCMAFILPRLSVGGFIVFDDYGFPTCPGAREAVDEVFLDRPEYPLCLPTGQAVVFKS